MHLKWDRISRKSESFKRIIFLVVSVPVFSLLLLCCATAQEESNLAEAIGFLAKEKSLAESYGKILEEFGKDNPNDYVEGIRLYANAKAEYDGLIEQLKWNLSRNEALEQSSKFQGQLQQAAEQRVAFTNFVTESIIKDDPGKKNPLAVAAITAVPALLEALTEVGTSIWNEYRKTSKENQQVIEEKLDSAKWVDFSKIAGGG